MGVGTRPNAVIAMSGSSIESVFSAPARARLGELVNLTGPVPTTHFDDLSAQDALQKAELLITGWGTPRFSTRVLDRMPNLRAIVHTAGTVKTFLDDDVFRRGIRVTSSASANAIPVAEYTVAAITFGRKRALRFADQLATTERYRDESDMPPIGANGTVIGIVGASRVGREVIRLLRSYNVSILVYDPYLSVETARALDVELVTLHELCRRSDVLSIHAPMTPDTVGMISTAELAQLRDGAVIINTARGPLIDTSALIPELMSGRLDAFLDVTDPEPLPKSSPLYSLPNVFITPHVAGALGNEINRLGDLALSEIAAYAAGEPFHHEVRHADLERIA